MKVSKCFTISLNLEVAKFVVENVQAVVVGDVFQVINCLHFQEVNQRQDTR